MLSPPPTVRRLARLAFLVLLIGLLMLSPAAVAQTVTGSSSAGFPMTPTPDYLLTLGPFGALVFGAIVLARAVDRIATGIRLTFVVELSPLDRSILQSIATRLGARDVDTDPS